MQTITNHTLRGAFGRVRAHSAFVRAVPITAVTLGGIFTLLDAPCPSACIGPYAAQRVSVEHPEPEPTVRLNDPPRCLVSELSTSTAVSATARSIGRASVQVTVRS
jgi:hypothetical protein